MNIDLIQDFNFFNNIDYTKLSKNIIVSSLYKLESISINRFNKNYMNIIQFAQKIAETFNLSFILFIDYTIYENKKYLQNLDKIKNKNTFIIKYDFPDIKKYSAFQQFYGDLIKLCPLFDYENNNFENVFIFDVEYYLFEGINKNELDLWTKTFDLYNKNKLDIIHSVFPFTKISYKYNKYNPYYVNKDDLILFPNKIICKYKFDNKIFDKIMFKSIIEKRFKQSIKNKLLKKEITSQTFLTFILYNYIKKLETGYIEYYNLIYIINRLSDTYFDLELTVKQNEKRQSEIIKMFQYIIQTDENNFKILYRKLINKINVYLNRFYNYIEIMDKSKNYKIFDKYTIKYILSYKYCRRTYNFIYKNKYNLF